MDFNEQEKIFFDELMKALTDFKGVIRPQRMSDKSLSIFYGTYPVGKIKLTGKKHWMQILKGLQTHKTIEGEIGDFIQHIPEWVRYIRYLERG